jgi:glycosyltransferase involved in cell wall biosynthesis
MSNKKKFDLRIVSQLFYPEMVSSGQALTELAEELTSYGLKIKVIAAQPTILENSEIVPKRIDYKGIHIIRTWSTRFPKLSFIGKFFNLITFFITASFDILINDRKVPLLLVTNPPYMAMIGWINNILYRTKYGILLFDIMPEQAELLEIVKPGGVIKLWRKINKLCYIKASYAVVLSKDMFEGAISNANLSGTKYENECRAKTHIIHVWSDDRVIKPKRKSDSILAKELNVLDKLVLQYSGNHGRFHDIESILKLAASLSSEKDFLFQFIGEGFKKKNVVNFKEEKVLDNIYISTYVPKEQLQDSLAMADIGIIAQLPMQERVCYPSKLLGIMSSGRPVLAICSPKSDMAKMIVDNDLGYVVENGDIGSAVNILKDCLNNRDVLIKKGDNAFKYLNKNFTLRSAAEKYYSLINKYQ